MNLVLLASAVFDKYMLMIGHVEWLYSWNTLDVLVVIKRKPDGVGKPEGRNWREIQYVPDILKKIPKAIILPSI